MAGPSPADDNRAGSSPAPNRSNLVLRVLSSLVLAPLAVAAAYFGGLPFLAFWAIAALIVLWEWDTLVCAHDRNPVLTIGAVSLTGAALLLAYGWRGTAIAFVVLGAIGVTALASRVRRAWCAAGLLYSAVLLIAPVVLHSGARLAFAALIFLFVIVWATDIAAYFAGRTLGGPKLMPAVSPNKTWSGAIGGTLAGVICGAITAWQFGLTNWDACAALAFVLSVAAQAGDLAESAIKRRFNAKDASSLIPGHGGLMDRLDGFIAAVLVATLIGLVHGGLGAPARGLMVW